MANLGQLLMQGLQAGMKMRQQIESIAEANELKEKYRTYGLMAQKVLEAPPEMRADVWRRLYEQLPEDWKVGVSPDYNPDELEAFLAKSAAGYLYLQHRVNQLKMEGLGADIFETKARGTLELARAYCETHQNDPRCNAMLSRERLLLRYGTRKGDDWNTKLRKYIFNWAKLKFKNKLQNISLQTALNQDIKTWATYDKDLPEVFIKSYQIAAEYRQRGMNIPPELAASLAIKQVYGEDNKEGTPQLEKKGYPSLQSGKVIDENRNQVLLEWKKKQGLIK